MSKGILSSVLIVENESGDVYIVENRNDKIKVVENREINDLEFVKNEISNIQYRIDENQDDIEDDSIVPLHFIDPEECEQAESFTIKLEPNVTIEESQKSHTFDGNWSSDDDEDINDFIFTSTKSTKHNERTNDKKLRNDSSSQQSLTKPFCKYCNTTFASRKDFWMHLCRYLSCDPENFTCRFCGKEFSKKIFNDHVENHTTFDCQFCNKKFHQLRNLRAHIINVHGGIKNESGKGIFRQQSSSINKSNAISSISLSNEKLSPINCLLKRKGVRTKIKYPRKKQRFECDICGKYLVSLRSLHFHMNLHRGDSTYICASCGEKFYTPNGIKGHSCEKKRRRPEKDFRTYDCRYCRFCDQRFSNLDENKAHKCEYQHVDDPKLINCRVCGKVLSKLGFNRHMETHSGVDWACGICHRKLATERALKTHLTTHTGNKPYKCSECSESFINKVVLDRHMRFHGQTPKLFRCEFCFKQLSTETSLKSHVQRLHRNTVQCELCKLEFANRECLKDHFQNTHPPSMCKICGKSFALPRYLKMHEKLHFDSNGQNKVACDICSKQLAAKNIKHHVYRHHREQFDSWSQNNPNY